jgi:hypothetical protein
MFMLLLLFSLANLAIDGAAQLDQLRDFLAIAVACVAHHVFVPSDALKAIGCDLLNIDGQRTRLENDNVTAWYWPHIALPYKTVDSNPAPRWRQ